MDNPVVLDVGSESLKAGLATDAPERHPEPRIVTPSLVHVYPRGVTAPQQQAASPFKVEPVVERGVLCNLDYLESLLHYVLYDCLGWRQGDEGALLFVEPLFTARAEREALAQLMFERLNVSGLFVHDAPLCSLFACGQLSGTVVDIGHGKIDVATVADGTTNLQSAARLGFAGEQLTQFLGAQLARAQPGLQLSSAQLGHLKAAAARAAPSQQAFAAFQQRMAGGAEPPAPQPDQQQQHQQTQPGSAGGADAAKDGGGSSSHAPAQLPPGRQEYTLPDGQVVSLGLEGVAVGEALLEPTLMGIATPGLADCLLDAANGLPDLAAKRAALSKLLLCGGGSCIPGLHARLLDELRAHLPSSLPPGLLPIPEYQRLDTGRYLPWVGGAVLAKIVAHQGHWLVKAEYEEIGPSAVNRKCA